jgi:hypothetical protein
LYNVRFDAPATITAGNLAGEPGEQANMGRLASQYESYVLLDGIQFVTDLEGRKIAVPIGLRKHGALWEDIQDGLVSRSRRHEKGIPLEKVKADLVKQGKLRG